MIRLIRDIIITGGLFASSTAGWGQNLRPSVRELIAVLQQENATLHSKARACQQLGEFGTAEAVPALAALLPDKTLSAYARSGLEGIPDAAAAAALRAALRTLQGDLLIGVVNSLGVLRDAESVEALSRLATGPASGAAKQALLALGRISNEQSIAALRRAISSGPDLLRADAAAGCLLAAERQLAEKKPGSAAALYDLVRTANVPVSFQTAATRGAILARESDGVDLLVKLLQSEEREARDIALYGTRAIERDRLTMALRAAVETAKPEVQAQLLDAIADCCRDAESMRIVRDKLRSEHPDVRQAALKALGKTGDRASAPVLLKALLNSSSPMESSVAIESLARIQGPEADRLIIEALSSATRPAMRVALTNLLDARPPARAATGHLLKLASDTDLNVSVAALRALRSFAGQDELPALVALTRTYKDGAQRGAAELALYYASTVTADSSSAGELLLAELKKSVEDLDKASLIKTLSLIGYDKALPSIAASLRDSNSWLVNTTIDNLGKWPDPTPSNELLSVVETSSDTSVRTRALAAAIQLVTPPFGKPQFSDATLMPFYRRATVAAKTPDDKRKVIAGLAQWRTPAGIRMVAVYLDDPGLKSAAAGAILDAAPPVAAGQEYAMLKPLLDRISSMGDKALMDRVENLKSTIAATESALRLRGAP